MKNILPIFLFLYILTSNLNAQWIAQSSGITNDLNNVFFIDEMTGWVHDSRNIYKTTNAGSEWFLQVSQDSFYVSGLTFLNQSTGWYTYQIYETMIGGIYKTTDGGTSWNLQMTTGQDVNIGQIQFTDSSNGFCIGTWSMGPCLFYKTTNGGLTWSTVQLPINLPFGLSFINSNTGWIAGATINKTTNAGISWTQQFNIDPLFFSFIQFVNDNTGWAFSRGWWPEIKMYKTTNGGQSWFQQPPLLFNSIQFIDESFGWALMNSIIYRTTDGGESWEIQYSDPNNSLRDIFFLNQNQGWVVGDSGLILYTNNGGTPIELVSFNIQQTHNKIELTWITASEKNNNGFELERKSFNCEDWNSIGFIEGKGTTTEVQYYSFVDENLFPGKYQYRLKQIDFDGTFSYSNIVEVDVSVPNRFSLEQNYPNPFNPTTKIRYTVADAYYASPAYITLKVYDVLGNEIATLVNEYKTAGSYEVDFDASSLSSGVYYYRIAIHSDQLKAGDPSSSSGQSFIQTKKMILIK